MKNFIVAIDGTSASGKGTIGEKLAEIFNFAYLDTGLNYRSIAKASLDNNISSSEKAKIIELAKNTNFNQYDKKTLSLDEVGAQASKIATIEDVRKILVDRQREFANQKHNNKKGVILDGRDIGSVVCPAADIKFYIDAKLNIRAKRRALQLGEDELNIYNQLKERDNRDKQRKFGALVKLSDAYLIDTTSLTIDQAVAQAQALISKRFEAFLLAQS